MNGDNKIACAIECKARLDGHCIIRATEQVRKNAQNPNYHMCEYLRRKVLDLPAED